MKFNQVQPITKELKDWNDKIRKLAKELNLDFFELAFEMCTAQGMSLFAANEGFPVRYTHWRFGQNYETFLQNDKFGLGKIYELVINNDPSYAYLLNTNSLMEQKLVIAHVYGHSDFFKNNYWFSNTNRDMLNQMKVHAKKIDDYIEKYGQDTVETFIDKALSLENLISIKDMHKTKEMQDEIEYEMKEKEQSLKEEIEKMSKHQKELADFLNKDETKKIEKDPHNKVIYPERDILKFLIKEAPLKDWERDILSIIRDEAYYFLPQRMTKIMNEGWASYWHVEMMSKHLVTPNELTDYALLHSGVVYMDNSNINPYKLGIELFDYIKKKWDTGRHGIEFETCDNYIKRRDWDTKANQGIEKIFEVRKIYNDLTFIQEFFTEEFCNEQKFFLYDVDQRGNKYISSTNFKKIKDNIINSLANAGTPVIDVTNSNYGLEMGLLLEHTHYGEDLNEKYAERTLKNLYEIWKRPVFLKTKYKERQVIYAYSQKGFYLEGEHQESMF